MNYSSIVRYMQDLSDEGYATRLIIDVGSDGDWFARIQDMSYSDQTVLLDRNGDKFMNVTGGSMDEALSNLNALAAVGE